MAYDLTIHEKTLRRDALRKSDFVDWPEITNEKKLQNVLSKAEKTGTSGFKKISLIHSVIGGRSTYKLRRLSDELVLRLIAKSIRRLTSVRQTNRVSIVKSLKCLLEEGVEYRVYKLDIKSFYETVDTGDVLDRLEADKAFSRASLKLLHSFFDSTTDQGIVGLPRGMAISATLAEFTMRDFDRFVRGHSDVFYYSRFVDDMILVTSAREKPKLFLRTLYKRFPTGLHLNRAKTTINELNEKLDKKPFATTPKATFDYLGYQLKIYPRARSDLDRQIRRRIVTDISDSKTNKIKTKVTKCLRAYCKDQDFQKLLDRLKVLTGNYTIYDHARNVRRKSGIYFNYRLIDGANSDSLEELDRFLRRIVLATDGALGSTLSQTLSTSQKRALLRFSFTSGFSKRTFYHFPGARLVELMSCWNYA